MANSYVLYPGQTGSTTDYAIGFDYLSADFVKAVVDGVDAPFTFLSTSMIRFDTAPDGDLKIYRETDRGPIHDFNNGSILLDDDLNTSFLQALDLSEEAAEGSVRNDLDGHWDAADQRIKNVADPVNAQDAATLAFVNTSAAAASASAVAAEAILRAAGDASVASLIGGDFGPLIRPDYDSRTAASLASINALLNSVRTNGYSAAGDGGGALYKRVVSEPAHTGKFQSADGAWWEVAEDRVGPAHLGAPVDGASNAAAHTQDWLDYLTSEGRGGHWPMSAKQRYYIDAKVTSVMPDLSIVGDLGPARQQFGQSGYITGPASGIECLLDWGDDTALGTGALHLEKLRFYRSSMSDYPAIRVTIDSNGPSRGMTLKDVSCRGFDSLITLEAPTATDGWLVAANLTLENCNVLGCTYSVNALDRVYGARIVGNQLEQGASIHGLLDGPVTITDNMLEGQPDAVRIYDVSHSRLYLARNYFEGQSGDYAVSFETENRNSEICIDENFGWNLTANTCTDLIRLIGQGRMRFLPDSLLLANNRKQLVSLKGWHGYMADFNGQGFMAYANVANTFFAPINQRYVARSTAGWAVNSNLAAISVNTPVGPTTTARSETAFAFNLDDVVVTPTTGDLVVMCALMKIDEHTTLSTAWAPLTAYTAGDTRSYGGVNWTTPASHTSGADFDTDFEDQKWVEDNAIPAIRLYDSTNTLFLTMTSGLEWPNDADGQWLLFVSAVPATFTEATKLQIRFGANGTGSGNHTMTVASIAAKVIPAALFDNDGRVSIDHLVPPVA